MNYWQFKFKEDGWSSWNEKGIGDIEDWRSPKTRNGKPNDIIKEEKRVNKILKYKNPDESLQFIQEYLKNVSKYLERIFCKPKKMFLYHLNNQQVIEQEFNIVYKNNY